LRRMRTTQDQKGHTRMHRSQQQMPLVGHLEELRRRLLVCLLVIGAGFAVAFAFSDIILEWLRRPLGTGLIFLAPAEALWATLKASLFVGLGLAMPVIFYQLWQFVGPGLLPQERRLTLPVVIFGTVCFTLGVAFCYVVVLPFALTFLMQYGLDAGMQPQIAVGFYLNFVLWFLLVFGLTFELPLVLVVLVRLGLATPNGLARTRKYAVVAAFVLGAILTPTPDVFNQALLAGPLILLYEVGILAARVAYRRTKRSTEVAESPPPSPAAPVLGLPGPGRCSHRPDGVARPSVALAHSRSRRRSPLQPA